MSTRDLDRAFVWRPYTSSEDHATRDDPVIVGAEGSFLHAEDGTRFFDASGSWWTNNLGYGHPRLKAALHAQIDSFAHVAMSGCTHAPGAELAQRLVEIGPRDASRAMARVFYSDDGSTSVEVALKMALQYWRQNGREARTKFLALPGAYHGDTIGAMSVGGVDEFVDVFRPLLFDVNDAPQPRTPKDWERAIGVMIERLEREPDSIAGVIVEPIVQGAAGMRMYAPRLLSALRDACDRVDTFLIADEVFTGIGRTGTMWACEHAAIAPDILCTAKGLSGGMMPFAATLATQRVYDGFAGDTTRALLHGHTFYGNPLGARLALEVLDVYRDEAILEGVVAKAARLKTWVHGLDVHRPRALGMVAAFDLGDEGYHGRRGWALAEKVRAKGVLLRPLGDTIYLVPPLNVSDEDLETVLDAISTSL